MPFASGFVIGWYSQLHHRDCSGQQFVLFIEQLLFSHSIFYNPLECLAIEKQQTTSIMNNKHLLLSFLCPGSLCQNPTFIHRLGIHGICALLFYGYFSVIVGVSVLGSFLVLICMNHLPELFLIGKLYFNNAPWMTEVANSLFNSKAVQISLSYMIM